MSGFPILDLVVGMIFVYFLLSIISSSAIEMILTGLNARAKLLEEWLSKVFDQPMPGITIKDAEGKEVKVTLGKSILDHCSVSGLSKNGKSPSYIGAKNFTSAFLEKITYDEKNPKSMAKNIDEVIEAVNKSSLLSTEFQRVLLNYANEAKATYIGLKEKTESEIELFQGKIENWYDSSMDRLTGNMKKKYIRPFTFIVALIITVSLNVDSVALAKYLYSNPEVRSKIAMEAFDTAKDSTLINQVNQIQVAIPDSLSKESKNLEEIKKSITDKIRDIEKAKQGLSDALPLTWKTGELNGSDGKFSGLALFSKIGGLLATILAIMMGAPFWFDILNKISNLRSTGAKPALSTSGEEKK